MSSGSSSQTHSAQGDSTPVSVITGGSLTQSGSSKDGLHSTSPIMQDSHIVSGLKRCLPQGVDVVWETATFIHTRHGIQVTRIFSGCLGRLYIYISSDSSIYQHRRGWVALDLLSPGRTSYKEIESFVLAVSDKAFVVTASMPPSLSSHAECSHLPAARVAGAPRSPGDVNIQTAV